MNLKISKSQWEQMGKKAGWMKIAQEDTGLGLSADSSSEGAWVGRFDELVKEINEGEWFGRMGDLNNFSAGSLSYLLPRIEIEEIRVYIRNLLRQKEG